MIKTADAIIIGGGIIGLSVALALRKDGADVLVVERGEPGREASHAAAGMLAPCDLHTPSALRPLAAASAQLYPEFVHQLEDESGEQVDFSRAGAIVLMSESVEEFASHTGWNDAQRLDTASFKELEPHVVYGGQPAFLVPEASVDPRALISALLKSARHHGVHISSGAEITQIEVTKLGVTGVMTRKTHYAAPVVVNCAGAWAGQVPTSGQVKEKDIALPAPVRIPTRPVKGHMLAVAPPISYTPLGTPTADRLLRRPVRLPNEVYLVPRSDGRIIIGSTLEEAGYDKRVDPETIKRLHHRAALLLPDVAQARILESWTGLRPGTPDDLPIIGPTRVPGYLVATGHYRDGILLAPITAQLIAELVRGASPEFDLAPFAVDRFESQHKLPQKQAGL